MATQPLTSPVMHLVRLVRPSLAHLPAYVDALERGWSFNMLHGADPARQELEAIRANPPRFLAEQIDPQAKGPPIELPDGTLVPRLPGYRFWLWDGEFCGVINFRWQPGTTALPPHCLGHIGYSVVPWKQRRGYATQALGQVLHYPRQEGLAHVDITTDSRNLASQRVIEANGGALVEHFVKPAAFGASVAWRFRIPLR